MKTVKLSKAVNVRINGVLFVVPKGKSEVTNLVFDILAQFGYIR